MQAPVDEKCQPDRGRRTPRQREDPQRQRFRFPAVDQVHGDHDAHERDEREHEADHRCSRAQETKEVRDDADQEDHEDRHQPDRRDPPLLRGHRKRRVHGAGGINAGVTYSGCASGEDKTREQTRGERAKVERPVAWDDAFRSRDSSARHRIPAGYTA